MTQARHAPLRDKGGAVKQSEIMSPALAALRRCFSVCLACSEWFVLVEEVGEPSFWVTYRGGQAVAQCGPNPVA